jgi:hypothetical protein
VCKTYKTFDSSYNLVSACYSSITEKEVKELLRKTHGFVVLIPCLLIVLLVSNIAFTTANTTSPSINADIKQKERLALPSFLRNMLAMLLPNASEQTLNKIRGLWIHQLLLKQARIEASATVSA